MPKNVEAQCGENGGLIVLVCNWCRMLPLNFVRTGASQQVIPCNTSLSGDVTIRICSRNKEHRPIPDPT